MKLHSAHAQSAYWEDGELRIVNHLTRLTFRANPVALEIVRYFFKPRTIQDALLEFDAYAADSVGDAILRLLGAELLLECGSAASARDELFESSWKSWRSAGAFHSLTKDAAYVRGDYSIERILETLPPTPSPPFFKEAQLTGRLVMPAHHPKDDSFHRTLHARRTRREFSEAPVPLEEISRLLQTTWGVQGYDESEHFGALPLKTSPSAGARHPVEVYLMALNVGDLAAGLYHYDTRGHALEKLPGAATPQLARAYCADQPYVAHAAALFIMTGVFARTMWKYPHPRAYRVVLLDAGHLAQTFCLTATHLGLAPFSTAALQDSLVEKDLGLDGITESVLYVTGVGTTPHSS